MHHVVRLLRRPPSRFRAPAGTVAADRVVKACRRLAAARRATSQRMCHATLLAAANGSQVVLSIAIRAPSGTAGLASVGSRCHPRRLVRFVSGGANFVLVEGCPEVEQGAGARRISINVGLFQRGLPVTLSGTWIAIAPALLLRPVTLHGVYVWEAAEPSGVRP